NVTGGRHLLAGSIEYEQRIKDKWSAAVFYDIGNAIDSFSDSLKSAAGIGIRWKSPVGPVRADLAFPLNASDESWRIHFIVGPDL
ncbi:MAG: BamA/TamA family outer membrane protein, partial [Candidatus Mariimomonas ferrooxydans]